MPAIGPVAPLLIALVGLGAMFAFGRKKSAPSPAGVAAEMAAMPAPVRDATEKVIQSGDPAKIEQASKSLAAAGFTESAKSLQQAASLWKDMPLGLRKELAEVLKALRLQPDGSTKPPIAASAVQQATALAGKLERAGYKPVAQKLRAIAQGAARYVPSPPPEQQVDVPGLSAPMREKVSRALQMERDPAKLKELVLALQKLPPSEERTKLSEALEALITSTVAKQSTDDALRQADAVMKAAPPAPQTPAGRLAQQTAASLLEAQKRYGMPRAKGRENRALVKRFQQAAGQTADGLAGPSTLLAMARAGASRLPLVMYWPRRATRATVRRYQAQLLAFAKSAAQQGQNQRAQELKQSAARERGQAGVVKVGMEVMP